MTLTINVCGLSRDVYYGLYWTKVKSKDQKLNLNYYYILTTLLVRKV